MKDPKTNQLISAVIVAIIMSTLLTLTIMKFLGGPSGPSGPGTEGIESVAQKLGLDDAQQKSLLEIRQEFGAQGHPLEEELTRLEKEFAIHFVASPTSPNLRSLNEQVEAKRNQLRQLKFEGLLRMGALLNQAQREKFMAGITEKGRPRE